MNYSLLVLKPITNKKENIHLWNDIVTDDCLIKIIIVNNVIKYENIIISIHSK